MIDELNNKLEKLENDYLEFCEQPKEDPIWLDSFNGPNDDLFYVFFSEDDVSPIMISMPLDEFKEDDASKIADVERYVIESMGPEGDSVKRLAVGFEGVDDARLGVAVTFQACLHLDATGKVELSQGVDDVLVKTRN